MHATRFGALLALALLALSSAAWAQSGPLQVRRISPSGNNVEPGKELVIQFDRTMRPLGNMELPANQTDVRVSPDPGCDWRWLDTTELACRLPKQQTFRPATRYTVTVNTSLKALDGSHLARPVTETFTTTLPRVEFSMFDKWLSPVEPRFRLRFNLPVTAQAVAAHVRLHGVDEDVPVTAAPFTQERHGPVFLPVPGAPGAVMVVPNPAPTTPIDVHKAAGAARRVWLVTPARGLKANGAYDVIVARGLTTPLGPLPGEGGTVRGTSEVHTYGAFAFNGIRCTLGGAENTFIVPGDNATGRCRPGSVSLVFSAPVPVGTLAAIQWSPQPPVQLAQVWKNYPQWWSDRLDDARGGWSAATFPLTFKLAPMHGYTITVPAGVKDSFGRSLASPVTVHFQTDHYLPSLDLPTLPAVLESGEDTILPLTFTNLDFLQLRYRVLHAADLVRPRVRAGEAKVANLLDAGASGGFAQRVVDDLFAMPEHGTFGRLLLDAVDAIAIATGNEKLPAAARKPVRQDETVIKPLGVRALLGGRSGLLWGHIDWSPSGPYRPVGALVQVTPYEVLAKLGHFNSLVWVSSFKTGAPVAGAAVRLLAGSFDPYTTLAAAGGTTVTTDADGLAVLPGAATLNYDRRNQSLYVSVAKGDAMALLPLDYPFQRWVNEASHGSVFANQEPRYGHMLTWLVTNQGIYKPGSDIDLAIFVRNQDNATLIAPPALDYTLTITDPTNATVLEKKHVTLDAFGEATVRWHVGANAPTGHYTVSLSWPSTTATPIDSVVGRFVVTDFVPAAFKVETLLEGRHFGPGDTVRASTRATLHAGGPYTDAKVRFTTQVVHEPFAPDTPVASGFTFGHEEENVPPSVSIDQTDTLLDHAGQAKVQVRLPTNIAFDYGRLEVEAAVQSARGTRVAARANAVYSARDRYIGVRTDNWLQTAGKAFDVEYVVVDIDGKPRAGSNVTLQLQRHVISTARVKNAAGVFEEQQHDTWQTEGDCHAVSATAPAQCALTPKHAGTYRVLATVTDTHDRRQVSELDTWVTGPGQVLWRQDKGVTLVPDHANYHVGDTAHVLVQNPFPEARALVTVERYGMLWKQTLTLKGGAPVIDIPIDKSMFPGAWLSVILYSPRVSPPADPDLGKPKVAMGYIALNVQGKGSALKVAVTPDAPEHKPRQDVHATVAVQTCEGKPAAHARVVVAVIDQGVVDLLPKGADTWDPLARFYAPPENPDIANYSLAEQLVTRLKPRNGKGDSPGGGGGASIGPNLRSQFKTAVYWNASLTTDADGKVAFDFKLPDNLTRWRIIAVAMTPGDAMGWGTGSVRVNLPIQVQPALPNQVHVGDAFDAGFNVTNRTGVTQHIATRLTASGPIKAGAAQASGTLDLDRYAHGLSWLPLTATGTGAIRLTATATAGKLGDAMTATIPVRRAGADEVAAEYGSLTADAASIPVSLPKNALPGSARLDVNLAPTLLGGLDGAFRYLRDDPLQTWEIRLSRGVLASDYLRLEPVLGDTFQWPDAASVVADMLQRAGDYQAGNGGMAFWTPREEFVSPYLSVYTALAFDWLDAAGHTPPAQVATKLRAYIKSDILDKAGSKDSSVSEILRAGAMAALAPHGMLPQGAVAGMLPKLKDLDLFGRALLLEAALDTHDKASAQAILKSLLNQAEESGGELSFNEPRRGVYVELLSTPLRANCAVLDAMVRYKREVGDAGLLGTTPQKLMRWVTAQKRNAGGWPNSQENVFCTTAMVHYADTYEPPVKDLAGQVQVGNQDLGGATFASRQVAAKALAPKLAADVMDQPFKVAVRRAGEGRLYYNVRLSYAVPPDALGATDAGISVTRNYTVQRGTQWVPVDANTVLERGDIIRVSIDVDAPTERHHVVLTDPLPGAFEAVNRMLATAMTSTPAQNRDVGVLMFDGGAWPNMEIVTGGFYHKETALDAVRFFADDLPAGHYRLIYSAQVVSPGRFIAPAPTAREIYQPDVFGRGLPQHLTVKAPAGK